MDLSWINIADTAVKIGLGASISAIAGYIALCKSNKHDKEKEIRQRILLLQEERKLKYAELLTQSQRLIQSSLSRSMAPDSDEFMAYLRAYNDVQIIATDDLAANADVMVRWVTDFAILNKNQQERKIVDDMVGTAREQIIRFRKLARDELAQP